MSQFNHFIDPEENPTRTEPLNPTDISMGTKIMTVQQVIDRFVDDRLIPSEFSHNQHLWNTQAKSKLIESLLFLFPLPAFYIDATNDEQWFIIDGTQRIITFYEFIKKQSFSLESLDFFGDLHNKYFNQLAPRWQRRIKETKLTLHLILRGTPSEIKLNLYQRIRPGQNQ
jgi:hypothetical protein